MRALMDPATGELVETLRVSRKGPRWIVDEASSCWVWVRYLDRDGYGKTTVEKDGRKTTQTAQRWVYESLIGPVPDGMTLDHLCANRGCVNPAHLEPVPHIENVRRSRVQKLTQDVADEIKSLRGAISGPQVAALFGIGSTTVYDIWHGRRWA